VGSITAVAIRQPTSDPANHKVVLGQLKEASETASRQRGNPNDSYAQAGELIASGHYQMRDNTLQPVQPVAPISTVATLPKAPNVGTRAVVTDASSPTFLGALVGGGAIVCPALFTGPGGWVAG
jgi:hypothetical protein